MGGGDLNQKKSWHPHTLKNQEKVWKAEQAKSQEEKKLNDLRKEIEEERNREELTRLGRENGLLGGSGGRAEADKKLEWMYKSTTELINRDEYLLGRKIDKSFEVLEAEEKQKEQQNIVGVKQPINHVEHECVPFSIRSYKQMENTEQVDLQRKVMEDPLMLIKQREMESRRKILENPVKLKEIHRILKTDVKLQNVSSKKTKKSKKSKKSKNKHKKKSKSTSSSSSASGSASDEESDLDSKLAKKLKGGLLQPEAGLSLTKLLDEKYEKISKELDKTAGKSRKHSKKNKRSDSSDNAHSDHSSTRNTKRSRSRSVERRRYRSPLYKDSNKLLYSNERHGSRYQRNTQQRSRSRNNDRYRSRSSSRTRDIRRTNYRRRSRSTSRDDRFSKNNSSRDNIRRRKSRSTSADKKYDRKNYTRRRSTSKDRKISYQQPSSAVNVHAKSSKLTEEEKQARLSEMMSNASWREEERTQKVKQHREAYAREEQQHRSREFDKDFLNKEVKKAIANHETVGSRLRANVNNIQRTSAAMNSNFARK